jgi:hypothetical protein
VFPRLDLAGKKGHFFMAAFLGQKDRGLLH